MTMSDSAIPPAGGSVPRVSREERDRRAVVRPNDVAALPSTLTELYATSDDYLLAVGNRIRQRRIALGYDSQADFAEILRGSQSYVSKIERGDGMKLLIALTNIAASLDCSLDYLALRTDEPNPFIPDGFDDFTVVYQSQNAHHRAFIVQMLNIFEGLSPTDQFEFMAAATSLHNRQHGSRSGR